MITTGRAVVPDDLLRLKFVGDPQISPDGSRVAFVVTTLSQEHDEYTSSIWMVDATGGEPRRFTAGPKRDFAPRWSPDGTRLAFLSDREVKKKPQLYVIPVGGGEALRLTDLKSGVHGGGGAVWSPDGTRLAFVSYVGGWQEPEREEDCGKSRPARVITTAKYKFDGEGFVHDRRTHVFVVEAGGGEPRQVSDGDFPNGWPAWSPDATMLAFASERHETRDDDWADDIYVVRADGGALRSLTDTAGPMWHPMWSPDGRSIVYVGTGYRTGDGRNFRLFSVATDGAKPVCLTADWTTPSGSSPGRSGPTAAPSWPSSGTTPVTRSFGSAPIERRPRRS
jgi:Tol biopolymer transport system component